MLAQEISQSKPSTETTLLATAAQSIRKRDGETLQTFDPTKLKDALNRAWQEAKGTVDQRILNKVLNTVLDSFVDDTVDVEQVQDAVETALMRHKQFEVAKTYILYRHKRTEARQARVVPDTRAIADYVALSKYSQYIPELNRRETYLESVSRVEAMHIRRFPDQADQTRWAFGFVRAKKVLPSMRSLDNATPIPTPDGWKCVGEIGVGDLIFDQDGQPTKVLGLQKFQNIELFDVLFSDGSTLRASADHRWVTSTLDDRIAGGRTRIVTTGEIAKSIRQRSGNLLYPWKYNHAVWNPMPICTEAKTLPLDPYILGLWLGDGFSISGQFACHQKDAEIPDAYADAGFPVTPPASGNPYAWGTHGLATILRKMGLRNNKHVPAVYLRASFEQRLALVQGLMDSDGCTSPDGRSQFGNTNPALFEPFCELLSSLGIKYVHSIHGGRKEHHKDMHYISFFTSLPVHRLTRKLANIRDNHRASNRYRTIVGVEPSGRGDATCFLVESEHHTYLAGRQMIVTHNTLQFGGKAVEAVHCRAFNCCATLVDRPRAFAELFYLLLCGSGTGFSCQFEHIDKLPPMAYVDENNVIHHSVADSIEGWSNALDALILGHIRGYYVEFDYSPIRPRGAPLRTAGGKAPGHLGLKRTLEKVRKVLTGSAGRKLRPIEAYDIVCHTADAVLSGGVRRSATICMFSLDDSEMLNAKTGDWYITHPWRANSNNSAVLLRGEATSRQFKRVFEMVKQWGEPGFIFSHDINYMYNPCVEAALYPLLKITESNLDEARRRIGPQVNAGDTFTGFSFCNLTSVNAAAVKTVEEFQEAAKAATFIGTLQASYTKMPYLGAVSEMLAERDALLGVSMTGMLDNPLVACDPKVQRDTAEKIVAWNREFAAQLGIKSAARTTCIKPEGTGSLALGAVAPGHHAHHSRRYIRRIIAKDNDPIFLFLRSKNPQMCLRKPNGDWVVEFPIEAPQGATLKEDLTAINFLEKIRSTQQNWVVPGTARSEDAPGLTHNVSNTVQVKDDEWDSVADYLWEHQEDFAAVSLLPVLADKQYSFAPYEAVTTPEDEIRWNQILSKYVAVDYTEMVEKDDMTDLQGEAACAGGACLL